VRVETVNAQTKHHRYARPLTARVESATPGTKVDAASSGARQTTVAGRRTMLAGSAWTRRPASAADCCSLRESGRSSSDDRAAWSWGDSAVRARGRQASAITKEQPRWQRIRGSPGLLLSHPERVLPGARFATNASVAADTPARLLTPRRRSLTRSDRWLGEFCNGTPRATPADTATATRPPRRCSTPVAPI
jgi:hypothetical protein